MPTTIRVTQADIDNIAKKLDELAEVLTDRERAVFLTMTQLAGKELREQLQALSTGFRSAFQPVVGAKLTYDETADPDLKVSIVVEK